MSETKRKWAGRPENMGDLVIFIIIEILFVANLVGELGPHGDGEGVLARGESGMTQTDFLRLDDGDFPDPIV